MRSTEALAGALDRRQDLLRVLGSVDTLGRVKTAVAVAASGEVLDLLGIWVGVHPR